MKQNINHFLHNVEKWSNILKNPSIFTSQDFKSMFDHFSTLRKKGLNYNFQEYFKRIIPIILCKTLTLRNVGTLQLKQNLLKVCLEIFISKRSYHYRKPIDWFLYCI